MTPNGIIWRLQYNVLWHQSVSFGITGLRLRCAGIIIVGNSTSGSRNEACVWKDRNFETRVWLRHTVYSNFANSMLTANPWHAQVSVKQCNPLSNHGEQRPKVGHFISSLLLVTLWLSEPGIFGAPLSRPLDNHEIPRAKRVVLCEGIEVWTSWKKVNGYVGSSASAQTLAAFQRTELTHNYPPHFMENLSLCSLDQKPSKDLAVKLLSFLRARSIDHATAQFLDHVKASYFSIVCKIKVNGTSKLHTSFKDWYHFLSFPNISQVLAASASSQMWCQAN